jgi:type VI secretion system protein ImpA
MTAPWDSQSLREPISGEQPCGQNLDDTGVLSAFDALRLFGQLRSLEAPPDADDEEKSLAKARPPLEWGRIRADALDGLAKSKDLRLLAYLGTALLRTDGLPAFAQVLTTASQWLEAYWPQVYPVVDEDGIARRNALNCRWWSAGNTGASASATSRLPADRRRRARWRPKRTKRPSAMRSGSSRSRTSRRSIGA